MISIFISVQWCRLAQWIIPKSDLLYCHKFYRSLDLFFLSFWLVTAKQTEFVCFVLTGCPGKTDGSFPPRRPAAVSRQQAPEYKIRGSVTLNFQVRSRGYNTRYLKENDACSLTSSSPLVWYATGQVAPKRHQSGGEVGLAGADGVWADR